MAVVVVGPSARARGLPRRDGALAAVAGCVAAACPQVLLPLASPHRWVVERVLNVPSGAVEASTKKSPLYVCIALVGPKWMLELAALATRRRHELVYVQPPTHYCLTFVKPERQRQLASHTAASADPSDCHWAKAISRAGRLQQRLVPIPVIATGQRPATGITIIIIGRGSTGG